MFTGRDIHGENKVNTDNRPLLLTTLSAGYITCNLNTCKSTCRDLLDGKKDNLQVKENKSQGIFAAGVTEVRFFLSV